MNIRIFPRLNFVSALLVGLLNAQLALAQSATAAKPAFEVATIKPSADCGSPGRPGVRGGPGADGTLNLTCTTVASLILSYDRAPAGAVVTPNSRKIPIVGGPGWIRSDQFDIHAKAEGNPSGPVMMGPMLQSLLEDRFQLKIHREAREGPVYALTVAKGGFKLRPRTADCPPPPTFDPANPPNPAAMRAAASAPDACGMRMTTGASRIVEFKGITIAGFAANLSLNVTDLPVIDRTGITGLFNFHLEFTADDLATTDAPTTGGPSLFTALEEQLGLKLERTRGPSDVLVVDKVERPSEN